MPKSTGDHHNEEGFALEVELTTVFTIENFAEYRKFKMKFEVMELEVIVEKAS